ncbi:MAG: glycosyltransferase [Kocuria sp.]|nr:glycosyltransferase [Kocuria sp.]
MRPVHATDATGLKLLLISPTFHGYHLSIAAGFEQIGYTVQIYCYDSFDSVGMKMRNKFALELPEQLGMDRQAARVAWDTRRALEVLRSCAADRILLIKADTLGQQFWDELRAMNIPTMLWLYDDLSRHSFTLDFLKEFGPVISYAASETRRLTDAGVQAHYLPNAYDPRLCRTRPWYGPSVTRRNEIVFVGSRYPNRVELLEHLVRSGVPVRAYGRQWSHHVVDRLRTWEFARPTIPAERDISLAQAYTVQAQAAAAINVHGVQAGLTMRTFEVPGNGGLQLIDRADVAEFYDPGEEVLVFSDLHDLEQLCERALADPSWGDAIRRAGQRRSIAEHTFAHRARRAQEWWP